MYLWKKIKSLYINLVNIDDIVIKYYKFQR